MSVYWSTKKIKSNKNYIVVRHPLKFGGNLLIGGIKFCAGYGVAAEGSQELRKLLRMPMFRKAKILPLSFLKQAGLRPKDVQLIFGYDIYYHFLEAINLGIDLIPLPEEDSTIAVTPDFVKEVKTSLNEDLEAERKQLDEDLETMEEKEEKSKEVFPSTNSSIKTSAVEHFIETAIEQTQQEINLPELTVEEIAAVHQEEGLCIRILPDKTVCENKAVKASPSGYCFGHIRYDEKRPNFGKKERRRRRKNK